MFDIFRNVFFKKDEMPERSFIQYGLDVFVESPVGDEDRSRSGVGKDVINLFECLRRVDGNIDRAETEYREIRDGPLRTILRKQSNTIARSYAKRCETKRDALDAVDESRSRDVEPLAVFTIIQRVLFVVM